MILSRRGPSHRLASQLAGLRAPWLRLLTGRATPWPCAAAATLDARVARSRRAPGGGSLGSLSCRAGAYGGGAPDLQSQAARHRRPRPRAGAATAGGQCPLGRSTARPSSNLPDQSANPMPRLRGSKAPQSSSRPVQLSVLVWGFCCFDVGGVAPVPAVAGPSGSAFRETSPSMVRGGECPPGSGGVGALNPHEALGWRPPRLGHASSGTATPGRRQYNAAA